MDFDDQLMVFGDFIKGTCELMCPTSERKMREREKLVHPLERLEQTNMLETKHTCRGKEKRNFNRNPNYLADTAKIVKSFSRSAAGLKMPSPSDLRPFPVLDLTVSYLMEKIACSELETVQWVDRYNFVTDRLRAVRQDMVIQSLPPRECIKLLEPMVKFHVFAGYWLCEKPVHLYDPKMNASFLHECIKRLLVMYSAVKKNEAKTDTSNLSQNVLPKTLSGSRCNSAEHQMYALHLMINLGNPEVLQQARVRLLDTGDCMLCAQWFAFQVSLAAWSGNYVKVCRSVPKLAPLLSMAAVLHLPYIRRHALMVMTTAFSNKVLTFSVAVLQEILLWEQKTQVYEECQHYGIPVQISESTESCVHFQKGLFNLNDKLAPPSRLSWLDKILCNSTIANLLNNHDKCN